MNIRLIQQTLPTICLAAVIYCCLAFQISAAERSLAAEPTAKAQAATAGDRLGERIVKLSPDKIRQLHAYLASISAGPLDAKDGGAKDGKAVKKPVPPALVSIGDAICRMTLAEAGLLGEYLDRKKRTGPCTHRPHGADRARRGRSGDAREIVAARGGHSVEPGMAEIVGDAVGSAPKSVPDESRYDVAQTHANEASFQSVCDSTAEKFGEILGSMPDGIVITDTSGRIVLVNSQAEALFGYPRGELVSKMIETLVPQRVRVEHVGLRNSYVANARPRPMGQGGELFGVRRDRSEFPIEISLSPMRSDDGILVCAAVGDVSERMRVEHAAVAGRRQAAGGQVRCRVQRGSTL